MAITKTFTFTFTGTPEDINKLHKHLKFLSSELNFNFEEGLVVTEEQFTKDSKTDRPKHPVEYSLHFLEPK